MPSGSHIQDHVSDASSNLATLQRSRRHPTVRVKQTNSILRHFLGLLSWKIGLKNGQTWKKAAANACVKIRPHRRCWGVIFRMALVKGYRFTWGGGIFRPKPPVFDRSWRSPSKNTVKNSTEDTCSWTRPSKIGKRKVKKPVFFNFLTSIFWFATSFFAVPQVAGPGGGFLSFWTRFRTDFRRFVIAETLVFTVFFCFLHAWRLASKLPKTS